METDRWYASRQIAKKDQAPKLNKAILLDRQAEW